MITYQREAASAVIDEIQPLLVEHWQEIAHYPDIALNPDLENYIKLDEMGMSRIFTARSEGRLVGYAIFFVRHNMHYRDSLQATQDVLFLLPEFRNGRVGMRLIQHCDAALKVEGVQAVYQHVKTKHNFGPLLEHLGYELVDLIYAKRLD